MARPHKAGIDYFPLDTIFDDQVELLKLEFGSRAVGVLISLYQKIYANGYYTPWNEDILMLFARSACEDKEVILKILERSLERGIFDKDLYDAYGIITSAEVQQEYLRICRQSKRKQVILVKEYCLVTDPDLLGAISKMQTLGSEAAGELCEIIGPGLVVAASQEKKPGCEVEVKDLSESAGQTGVPGQELPQAKVVLQDEEPLQKRASGQSKTAPGPALRAAIKLRDRVRQNNPRATLPGGDPQDPLLVKWVSELDLLHRKGPPGAKVAEKRGYSWQEIDDLIDYCQGDSFWAAHILAPADLRKKAVTLEIKMRRVKESDKNNPGERTKGDMAGKYRRFVG